MACSMVNRKHFVCTVTGCGRKHFSKGYCQRHYNRLRRNGTLEPLINHRESAIGLIKEFAEMPLGAFAEVGCIDWPFTKNQGYGKIQIDGTGYHAHRKMLEHCVGAPPAEDLHAGHFCGNRLCVNPAHLYWATPKENQFDRYRHDTAGLKLSVKQVQQIFLDPRPYEKIARDYPITESTVKSIKKGETWWNVTDSL